MAIAVDAVSNSAAGTDVLTFAHTCTGTNLVLSVGFYCNRAISSVTYNGVAMTQGAFLSSGFGRVAIYYLIGPSTGANNIVITLASSGSVGAQAISFTGANAVGTGATAEAGATTTISTNYATVANNSYVHELQYKQSSTGITQNSSQTEWGDQDTAGGDRSAGARKQIVTAGTNAFAFTGAGSNASVAHALLEIKEGTATAIKTMQGLAIASVKTAQGLAIASVKNKNGLA